MILFIINKQYFLRNIPLECEMAFLWINSNKFVLKVQANMAIRL